MKKPKILYLCHRIPYPPNKGDKIRSYNQVRFLAKHADLDLITLADDPEDFVHESILAEMCRRVKVFPLKKFPAKVRGILNLLKGRSISQGYFYHPDFEQAVDAWILSESYDAVICFSSPMAGYLMKIISDSELPPSTRLIMDFCDLDSDKWLQYAGKSSFPMNFVYRVEGRRLLAFEKMVSKAFHHSVFVSATEADLFLKAFPRADHLTVVPNGVDYSYFDPEQVAPFEAENHPMLMFSGAMDYYANVEGVSWFVKEIFPRIRKEFPGAKFYIVGSNPDQKVKDLEHQPGVSVTGFVEDIRQYYKAADLCVIPLTIARGVQNKILEAMSMEKPIVTTSMAVQGIEATSGKELLVADTSEDFARIAIRLLKNPGMANDYGIEARRFIRKNHDWNSILELFYSTLFRPGIKNKPPR